MISAIVECAAWVCAGGVGIEPGECVDLGQAKRGGGHMRSAAVEALEGFGVRAGGERSPVAVLLTAVVAPAVVFAGVVFNAELAPLTCRRPCCARICSTCDTVCAMEAMIVSAWWAWKEDNHRGEVGGVWSGDGDDN